MLARGDGTLVATHGRVEIFEAGISL